MSSHPIPQKYSWEWKKKYSEGYFDIILFVLIASQITGLEIFIIHVKIHQSLFFKKYS